MSRLPKVIRFVPALGSGIPSTRNFYHVLGTRQPKRGEFYLSGAIIEAYEATFDMQGSYIVVEKGARAKTITVEVPA
jgi:hypothetical protein